MDFYRSAALINVRRKICGDHKYDKQCKFLRKGLIKSLRKNREQWWIAKSPEMEKATAFGNCRVLLQLIRTRMPRKPKISELIYT